MAGGPFNGGPALQKGFLTQNRAQKGKSAIRARLEFGFCKWINVYESVCWVQYR